MATLPSAIHPEADVTDAKTAAVSIVDSLRAQPWGLAVAALADGQIEVEVSPGRDPLDEQSLFEVGSITKTMTGLLLAESVTRGETSLDASVGSLLGEQAGNVADVTLGDLVTQDSGLPRLPPNLGLKNVDREDPYAAYGEEDLLEALQLVDTPTPGTYGYSNFGFMLLGLLLSRITGLSYAELIGDRIFKPCGMKSSLCGMPPESERLPGYAGSASVRWWTNQLPGAGGVASSISDLAR